MKLKSIQFLRAIAALLVVYAHSIDLQMQFSWSNQQDFYYLQNFGAIGVDLFFVISGFIITYVAWKYSGATQGLHFLTKRFFRINPVYYIASILFFGFVILQHWIDHTMAKVMLNKTINSAIDTLLILPSSGNIYKFQPLLAIGWTLSFEWLFYILFFILILFKARHKPLFMAIAITGLVALGYLIKSNDYRYTFITNPIILEFLLGVLICWLDLRIKKIPKFISIACVLIGLASYVILVARGFGSISEKNWVLFGVVSMRRFLIWGIPSAFLAAGCIFMEKSNLMNRFWNNKIMQLTGDASYSIYLIHLTIFSLLTMLYKKVGFFLNPDLAIFAQLAVATLVAIVFYKLVEKPLLKASQKITTKEPKAISLPKGIEARQYHKPSQKLLE